MLPIIIIIALGLLLTNTLSSVSIVWLYLGLAVGFSSLLLILTMFGFFDFGNGGSDAHHIDAASGDGGHDGGNVLVITPMTFLTVGALFGAYGLITVFMFSFLNKTGEYLSIVSSALLTGLTYFYLIKTIFSFLRTSGLVKSNVFLEGKEAEVYNDIPENGFGKITVKIDDKYEYFLARSEDGSAISAGSIVRIKKNFGNYVIVEKI